MSTEYLDIPRCPKCDDTRRYKLDVHRSMVVKMLTPDVMNERPRSVRLTRIFTCPVKSEEFQARFLLTDKRRHRYAIFGFAILCIGVVLGSWVLIGRLKA